MSLPGPIIQCGIYGIPLVLMFAIVQIYTATLLGRCWIIAERLDPSIVKKSRYPYAAIAEMTYGKYMSILVTILLDLTIFGAGIPNLLVASENLQLLSQQVSDGKVNISFCYLLIVIGFCLCPLMWLGSPKNIKNVAIISVFTVSITAILLWYCIGVVPMHRNRRRNEIIKTEFPTTREILTAYGIMAFQFDIHPMLLTIQVDMQRKCQIGRAVCYGVIATLSMATISAGLCAYKFGARVPTNILDALPKSGILYAVILLVTIQLCLSSAVGTNALFQHIESMLGVSRDFTAKRCIIRSFLIAIEVLIGELLPRFDVIMGLIGGTLTGPLIFILPPLFYSKMSKLERKRNFEVQQRIIYERRPIYDDEIELSQDTFGRQFELPRSEDTVIIRTSFVWKMGRRIRRFLRILYSDCLLSILVLSLGLGATISSTYFNYFKIDEVVADIWYIREQPGIFTVDSDFLTANMPESFDWLIEQAARIVKFPAVYETDVQFWFSYIEVGRSKHSLGDSGKAM
ncbi:unnamed protein product [Hermetia illucens]|uniref:Amino acid transporter transmembrane domain-containing protein n=1 Tax=Hermetia illucens TaxID=343691 RepID=A0A7R8UPY7_HERIL|nr:unnamed protein product [Hermetia illucens]